jgi:hypothetical protein
MHSEEKLIELIDKLQRSVNLTKGISRLRADTLSDTTGLISVSFLDQDWVSIDKAGLLILLTQEYNKLITDVENIVVNLEEEK